MAKIPSWYKPDIVGETGVVTAKNSLLPYLNAEGQIASATDLYTQDETFNTYDSSTLPPPSSLSPDKRKMYLSKERAERALAAIARMRNASGMMNSKNPAQGTLIKYDDAGNPVFSSVNPDTAGLRYLTDSIRQMQKLGANGGAMSRKNYLAFLDSTKALQNSTAAQEAGEYADLAKRFTNVEGTKPTSSISGRTIFGKASNKLFG